MATQIGQLKYSVGFDVKKQDLNALKASLQQIKQLSLSDLMKINQSDRASALSTFTNIRKQAENVEKAIKDAFNVKLNTVNIEAFNKSLQGSETSIEKIYATFKQAGTAGQNAFRNLSSQVLTTNVQLKQTHKFLDNIATTLANTVKWNIASGAVNALSNSVQQAWGYVKSLDTSLNDIMIVTGKSADEMAKFSVQANEAAKSLGKTTVDYTKAALIYAQQGLSDDEIAARAAITLKTANVTGQSTDQVSEELTSVWNGYKVNAEQAELYIDRLAAVAASTASDLEELSTGMSKVAAAAAAMGVGEDQLAAQLSTIISVTRQAPESVGTALRTVYARISDIKAGIDEDGVDLGRYSGKMAELGFNVLDVNGKLRDMGQVIEEIGGRWQGLTREQQVSLAQTMAGQRQYSNLIALFDNFEEYNRALGIAQNAAGTLQKKQDTYMENIRAHLNQLKAATEDLYDSLINPDSLEPLMDALAGAATFAAKFVDAIGGGESVLISLGAVGLSVFSDQIAKGINITFENLRIANAQAQEFENTLNTIKTWENIPELDQMSAGILAQKQQLQELSKFASPTQFQQMQAAFNGLIEAGNKYASALAQNKSLDDLIAKISQGIGAWKTFNEVVKDADAQEKIINKLKNQKKGFEEASTYLQQYIRDLQNFNTRESNSEAIQNLTKNLNEAKTALINYANERINALSGQQFTKQRHQVEKLKQDLQSLPDGLDNDQLSTKLQSTAIQFQKLSQNANASLDKIINKLNVGFIAGAEAATESVRQAEQQFNNAGKRVDNITNSVSKQARTEGLVKTVGGLSQIAAGIKQIQNLGSIWKNADLSNGQEVIQNIINSLPALVMGINGVVSASKALGTVLNFGAVGTGVIGAIISVLSIAAGAWLNYAEAQENAKKAEIDYQQSIIDEENKKQEQIEKNEELLLSIQKLNREYENGQIDTRADLRNEIDKLLEQYELEEDYIDKLITKYGNLAEGIKEARLEAAKERQESVQRELNAASLSYTINVGTKEGKKVSTIEYKPEHGNLYNEVSDIVSNSKFGIETLIGQFGWTGGRTELNLPTNIQQAAELYNALSEIPAEIFSKDSRFAQFYKWMDFVKSDVQKYNQAKRQLDDQFTILSNQSYQNFDQSIESLQDYFKQRQQIINEIQTESNQDITKITKQVDEQLKKDYSELYQQYNESVRFIEILQNRFGRPVSEKLVNIIGQLDSSTLGLLKSFDFNKFLNEDGVLGVIDFLSTSADRVQQLSTKKVSQSDFESAENTFNIYDSLLEQIQSSKKQTISKNTFKDLDEDVQKYFSRIANGQYKLTGDAEQFYNLVTNKSLSEFRTNIDQITASQQQLYKVLKDQQSVDLKGQLIAEIGDIGFSANSEVFDVLAASGRYSTETLTQWMSQINNGGITSNALYQIKEAIEDLGNFTELYTQRLESNKIALFNNAYAILGAADDIDTLKIRYNQILSQLNDTNLSIDEAREVTQAYERALIDLTNAADLSTLKTDELEQYSKYLQDIANDTEELSNELKDNAEAAQIVAKSIMKMNDGFDELGKNWDAWVDILSKSTQSSEQFANAMIGAQTALAQLLDISQEYISSDFVKQHLDLITEASNGSTQAIDNLKAALTSSVIDIIIDENSLQNIRPQIESLVYEINNEIPNIQVGAELNNDDAFVSKLQELVNLCGLTTEQVNALFDTWGFEPTFVMQPQEVEQDSPIIYTRTAPTGRYDKIDIPNVTGQPTTLYFPETKQYSWQDGVAKSKGTMMVPALSTDGTTPKINTIIKKATSNFSNYSARNAGGSATPKKQTKTKSEPKPDTSTKETKKPVEDDRDIYHDINLQLDQINRQLSHIQKKQDRLFGKQLIDNLNKQAQLLENHKVKLREKQELQKKDIAQKAEQLRLLGVIVNTQTGNIDNYLDALGQRQGIINGLIEQYNGIVGNYNATTDKDAKDAIKDQLTEVERAIKDAETDYKNLETKIKNYDALRKAYEDIADAIEEQTQKQIEIQITKFRMSVEISLEMGDAQREWNKFKREVLKADDVLKDSDFEKIIRDAQYYYNDIESYFTGSESVQQLTDKITDATERLKEWNEQGDDIYGDRKKQLIDNLKGDLSTLQGQMESIVGLMQDIDQAVIDTTNDIKNQMDEQLEDYEFVSDRIQYQIDLLQLLYGEKQYDAMDSYYERLEQNQLQEIDFLRKSIDTVKQRWMAARENGDEQYARQLEQIYQDLYKKMDGLVAEHAKTLQDEYTNAINGIFDAFDKRITNGLGLEYVEMEWELINKNADEYLDAINSAYALQDLERKYQKAITDNNTSVKNQRILTNLMNEQLDHLRDKEKLTQYDVERAEKLLQIEQARMALEDQKNAKTSLRLKRDSQGNYSYVYSANQDDILAAEENLAKLQNELYNFDKDTYKDNLNDILSAYKDFETRAAEIAIKYKDDEETRTRQLAKLREEYEEYISNKIIENTQIRSNLANSAFAEYSELYGQNYEDFKNMSDQELDVFLGQLVVGWNSGVQQMIFAFNGPDGLEAQVDEVFNNLQAATEEYKNKLITAGDTAGVVFEQLREGAIDPTIDEFSNLIDKNDDLIEKFNIQLEKIDALKRELTTLMGIYKQVWKDAQDAIDAGNKVLQQKYQQAKDIAKQEAETKPVTPEQQPQNLPAAPQTITPASVSTGGGTGTGSSTGTSKSGNNLPYWPTDKPSQTLEGIAGSIWLFGSKPFSWNNQPDRENKLIQVFGPSGAKMYDKVQNMFNVDRYGYEYLPSHGIDYDYYMQWTYEEQKKKKNKPVTAMDTGGYTGAWGPQGRLAVLHQKELVLNAQDTKNMLDSVEVLRGIVTNLGGSISARLNGLNGGYAGVTPSQTSDQIDQNVSIQANFPNVNSKREIEEAFSELVNLAAQRALRRT